MRRHWRSANTPNLLVLLPSGVLLGVQQHQPAGFPDAHVPCLLVALQLSGYLRVYDAIVDKISAFRSELGTETVRVCVGVVLSFAWPIFLRPLPPLLLGSMLPLPTTPYRLILFLHLPPHATDLTD